MNPYIELQRVFETAVRRLCPDQKNQPAMLLQHAMLARKCSEKIFPDKS
jgi:hypothetical protein